VRYRGCRIYSRESVRRSSRREVLRSLHLPSLNERWTHSHRSRKQRPRTDVYRICQKGRWGKPSCDTPPFKSSVRHRWRALLFWGLLDLDDLVLLPTAPDEDLGLWVSADPAIFLLLILPFRFDEPRAADRAATILANSTASSGVMFETAGGFWIILYFFASIARYCQCNLSSRQLGKMPHDKARIHPRLPQNLMTECS